MTFTLHPPHRPTTLTVQYWSCDYDTTTGTVEKITFQKEYPFKTEFDKSNLVNLMRLKTYNAFQRFNAQRIEEREAAREQNLADIYAELYNIMHGPSIGKSKGPSTTDDQNEFDIRSSTVMGQTEEDYRKVAPTPMNPSQTTLATIPE